MSDLSGQHLGQYDVIAPIGKGGMAMVYRARQASMDRDVAIKVIKPDLSDSSDFVERFKREAKIIASLSHPHILKVFDYGQYQNMVYLVMELLQGGNLGELLHKGALSLKQVSGLLNQMAQALDYAHRRGIIHRDLKPQNVLLDEEGNAHLVDFGIAKLLNQTSGLTQSGAAMGTPAYMSPEQWMGTALDARTDLYALGAILYEMLSGQVPFTAETPYSMMHMHIYDTPSPISALRSDLPVGVEAVINKALAKEREARFSSATELAAAFEAALSAKSGVPADLRISAETLKPRVPVQPTDPTLPPITPEPTKGSTSTLPRAAIIIGALLVIGVAILVIVLGRGSQVAVVNLPTVTPFPITTTAPTGLPTSTTVPQLPLPATSAGTTDIASIQPPTSTATPQPTVTTVPTRPPTSTTIPTKATATTQPSATIMATAQFPTSISNPTAAGTKEPTAQPTLVAALPNNLAPITAANVAKVNLLSYSGRGTIGIAAVSDDGTLLAAEDSLGVWLYDLKAPDAKPRRLGDTFYSYRMIFSPDHTLLATVTCRETSDQGCKMGAIKLWDLRFNNDIPLIPIPFQLAGDMVFNPASTVLVSGSDKDNVKLWDVHTGKLLSEFRDITDVASLAANPDGHTIAIGKTDNTILLRDLQAGRQPLTLTGHTGWVTRVTFSPDGSLLVSGSSDPNDPTLRLWNVASGKELAVLQDESHEGSTVNPHVAFSPDGKRLASASGNTIRIWDTHSYAKVKTLEGFAEDYVAFSPTGTLYSHSTFGGIETWNLDTGEQRIVIAQGGDYLQVAFSPNGKLFAVASGNYVSVRAAASAQQLYLLHAGPACRTVAFSRDGTMLASGSNSGLVQLWDLNTGKLLMSLKGHQDTVNSVAFSPDGTILASGSGDKTVRLWDVKTGKLISALSGHEDGIYAVAFSLDGTILASGSGDKTVRLWDVSNGGSLIRILTGTDGVLGVAFSPDKTLLASSDEKMVRLWNITGITQSVPTSTTLAESSGADSLAFSPDGSLLVTSGNDLKFWEVKTGKLVKDTNLYAVSVAFSPDGTLVAAANGDQTALLGISGAAGN